MLRHIKIATFLFSICGISVVVKAERLQCDAKQTYCLIDDRRLTYGDTVGIFNRDNEVVALAKVTGMRDKARKIRITKKTGRINKGYKVQRIEDNHASSVSKHYRLYKQPSKLMVGGSAGLATMNLAEDMNAFHFEGLGQKRWKRDFYLVARGGVISASGTAVDPDNENSEQSFDMQAFNAMGGIAYEVFRKQRYSLKGEADLGITYVMADVSGSSYPRSLEKIEPGVGLAMRAGASALFNGMGDWHPEAGVNFLKIMDARATTIFLGVLKKLK